MPISKMNRKTTFSKDEEETMATVVKGFETVNLPLTRRKFLSIVKKEKERKSEFFVCFAFSLLPLNLKLLLLVEGAGFLCCCSEVTCM